MPALNARLKPKRLFGVPLMAAVGAVIALASGLLTFLLPSLLLNSLTAILFVYGSVMATVALVYGEDLKFLAIRRLSVRDQKAGSIEVIGHG